VQSSLVIQECIIQIAVQHLESFFEIFVVCTSTRTGFLLVAFVAEMLRSLPPAALHPLTPLDISNWAITGLYSELLPWNMSQRGPRSSNLVVDLSSLSHHKFCF
jgi:hypothetical protein